MSIEQTLLDIANESALNSAEKVSLRKISREVKMLISEKGETTEIAEALELIGKYGGIDGGHHKQWVLDQVARILAGDDYDEWIATMQAGEDGPNTYSWDIGIAP